MCAIALCCSASSLAFAEASSASLNITVSDTSGAMIPDATVTLRNSDTSQEQTSVSNKTGNASFPFVKPGHYTLTVSKNGFSDVTVDSILLNVGDDKHLQLVLKVGAESQSVTVDGSGATINTTDGSVSTVIDQKFVENIPLNGRSFQDLISMTPGVVTQSPQAGSSIATNGDFSVNGQRTESNSYIVDGVSGNISSGPFGGTPSAATGGTVPASTALGTTQSLISVDAMQEFRVQGSTYSAEYGRTPGGQFSIVSRSGANTFHGTVFDYLRNNFFDANDWFNDHYGKPISALRQNDFGGTLGGPVWLPKLYLGKDRTFFFVSYEGLRLTQPTAASIQYVPDLFMRQQSVPAMQPILNAFPIPNGLDYGTSTSPNLAQFIAPFSLPSTIDSTSVRIDHAVSSRISSFFRYGDTPSFTENRTYFARTAVDINAQTFTLGLTAQVTDKLSDEFRLGYARSDSTQVGTLDNFGGASPINLATAMGVAQGVRALPSLYFYVAGIGTSEMAVYDTANVGRQWNVVDSLNWTRGRHSIKLGIDFRHIKSPLEPVSVEPFAEFINATSIPTGAPDYPIISNFTPATPLFNQTSLYAQDEWRLHSRLAISFGLRWEVNPPPTEQHGLDAYTLRGSLSNPSTLTLAPRGTPLWDTVYYDFAPRLGAAWTAHGTPGWETVVRSGGGVFFDSADQVGARGFEEFGFVGTSIPYGATLPFTQAELTVPISTAAPYTSSTIFAFPEHLQLPYTLQWNVSLQQALGNPQTFTLSYLGSAGRRLLGVQEVSLAKFNSSFGTIYYTPAGLTSNYQALQLEFQRSMGRGLHALASYTWSHSLDFGSTATELPFMRGNSDFDVRQTFQSGASWDFPSAGNNRVLHAMLDDWGLDLRLNIRTAFPVTIAGNNTTDTSNGNIFPAGLNLIVGQPLYVYGAQYPGGKAVNKAAFRPPSTGTLGDAPRNIARGFSADQENLAARRDFKLHDTIVLHFRAEAFNILNHPNFGYVDPLYADATFGQATKMLNSSLGTMAPQYQQGGSRSMQFALKVRF